MKIFVVNAGSSSLKYQLIDMENEQLLAKGICDRIGVTGAIKHQAMDGRVYKADIDMPDHAVAFEKVVWALTQSDAKVIDSLDEITAVGHRIVQGGSIFKESCIITPEVLEKVEELSELAPLHNPANILGVRACMKLFGESVPQVAVFDTAFHQTMEPEVYMYALPYEYYEKYGIRRYGAHGTSHKFVSAHTAEFAGKDIKDMKIITCHLGSGCSITAVKNGKSFDTSMGFTPLDGFMMGTRSGCVDPSALTFIAEKENLSPAQINDICNKKSGALGISGLTNDNRDLVEASANGNERAELSLAMQRYQIVKYIGSYIAAMNGVDAIVFTGGIGENNPEMVEMLCANFGYLGVKLDMSKYVRGEDCKISTDDSGVDVYVIPTNEELAIARDTKNLIA
ncbi:MAG: acetate kinase [Clostridia bacterium]|nr:acetate kinase [Clostridia bacterium]